VPVPDRLPPPARPALPAPVDPVATPPSAGRHAASTGAEPGVGGEPPARPPRARHRPTRASLLTALRTGSLWPLAALVAVGLVGAGTLRGRPLPDDGRLTGPAFDLLRGGADLSPLSPEAVGGVHAAVYATVTRAFERHATLAGAGRELMLAVLLVSALLVWRTTRRLGAGNLAAALAVLASGALPWLAPAHATGGPASLAALWLLLAAWLLAPGRPSPAAWAVASVAGVLAVLLAPDTLVLVVAGLAAAIGTGRLLGRLPAARRRGAAGLLAVVAVLARPAVGWWDPQSADPGRWAATQPGLVVVCVVLLVVALLTAARSSRLRPAGIAVAATTVLSVAPPSGRLPALLVCLPVGSVLLGVLLDGLLAARPAPVAPARRHRRRQPAWLPAGLVAAALSVALVAGAVSLGTAPRSDFGAATTAQLTGWAREALPEGSRLSVPADLRAELVHAGADPAWLGTAADLRVAATATEAPVLRVVRGDLPAGSAPVARLDAADGLPALTVVDPRPVAPTAGERDKRRVLGRALAANPATLADDDVRTILSSGELDPRLLSLLAGIGAASGIGIDRLPVVPGEEGRTLVRQAVVSSVGGIALEGAPVQTDRVLTLLRAQRAPYTPEVVRRVEGGLLVGYRYVPAPDALLTRAAGD
jgi:hypothetical protein